MNPLTISLISFVVISGSTIIGFLLGNRLPEHHLSHESKDAVKMAWGIVATMSALVLGLLVASAKESFDDMANENTQAAARIISLHHILIHYGPEADGVRAKLRTVVAASIQNDWQEDTPTSPVSADDANGLEQVKDMISELKPTTDAQHSLLAEAVSTCEELSLARWLLLEQTRTVLPPTLLVALVFWLSILFMGMALFAPHNKTVLATLMICSFSVSFAILLINDLSHPLKGLITISSAPMHDALRHLDK